MSKTTMKHMVMGLTIFVAALMMLLAPSKNFQFWATIGIATIMVVFWIFEVLPIYVTALLPLLLAVPLGVLDPSELAQAYGHKFVFLFFGGFMLSLALEKWGVHKRIAELIIRAIGNSKSRILLGFLLATALLSMWVSNTATALMMLPMAMAVIDKIPQKKNSKFSLYLLLAIAYGASIGGMGTLVGSPPNVAMAGALSETYNINIEFIDWFKYGFPLSMIMIFIVYFYFRLLLRKERKEKIEELEFEKEPWTKNQIRVLALFGVIVVLWSFKSLIEPSLGIKYGDEIPAVLGAILLFIVPSTSKGKTLLEWKDTRKMAWGILLLFGGGMALAKMMDVNGVVDQLSEAFENYRELSLGVTLLIFVSFSIFGTEVMSNLALVQVFVPIVAVFAVGSNDFSILQLCMPVTLAASCAFMLPVSTPPNAIIFSSGRITV
ncbi:SLC13 family permease, partial [Crocinitomicaceae bacterium]|nr:SLC13 family permease [Crocinitomicaceae bacterium]